MRTLVFLKPHRHDTKFVTYANTNPGTPRYLYAAMLLLAHWFHRTHAPTLKDYAAHFPEMQPCSGTVTGEAAPCTIPKPLCAQGSADILLNSRFIMLMRDSASRAWSHVLHESSKGSEQLPFDQALGAEETKLAVKAGHPFAAPGCRSSNCVNSVYKARERCTEQYQPLRLRFPRELRVSFADHNDPLFDMIAERFDCLGGA